MKRNQLIFENQQAQLSVRQTASAWEVGEPGFYGLKVSNWNPFKLNDSTSIPNIQIDFRP